MTFIIWSDFLSVGVAEIDAEHKNLVSMINSLHNHTQAGNTSDITTKLKLFDSVIEYTHFHFNNEKRLMEQHGYPSASARANEHQQFFATAVGLKKRLINDYSDRSMEAMVFLKYWLLDHVMLSDKLLGQSLSSKRLLRTC